MATAAKSAAIAELTDAFRNSGAAVLTVVKNTLTEIAAKEAGVTAFDGQLAGPSAIAFITGDPVEAAKTLRDFAKANPLLVIKSGMLDGKPLTADDIRKLADLESREVLLAKLAGALQASLSKAVYLFAAPLSQAARTVDALRAKVAESAPVADAPAAAAAAAPQDEVPQDEVPADAAPADADAVAAVQDSSTDDA